MEDTSAEEQKQCDVSVFHRCGRASSLGFLASDDLQTDIRLTGFSKLHQDLSHAINMQAGFNQATDNPQPNSHSESPKRRLSNSSIIKTLVLCPLKLNQQQQVMISNSNSVPISKDTEVEKSKVILEDLDGNYEQAQLDADDQFQVVWRALSFDVETSTYDKLINLGISSLSSLVRLGGLLSSSRHTKPVALDSRTNLSSTCQLSMYQSSNSLPQYTTSASHRRNVFSNLNGYIKSGEISAILGPSGAGKTSLLSALCGGDKIDNYSGTIQLLSGGTSANTKRRMRVSIIPQKDYLIENLTVRENLLYSSKLLNSAKKFNHAANIMRVVRMLNLSHCLESPASSISGGEYKRVSIAQELLRQPDILVLDEPTSGLDSLNCKNLIRTLKQLIEVSKNGALKPLAVVMTIHQPDIEIFNMFDHVYCMARAGRVIFDGHPSEVLQTIKSHAGFVVGDSSAPPELVNDAHVNPANLLIEIASEHIYGEEPIERLSRLQRKQFEQRFGFSAETTPPTNQTMENILLCQRRDKLDCNMIQSRASEMTSSQHVKSVSSVIPQIADDGRHSPNSTADDQIDSSSTMIGGNLKRDKRLITRVDHRGQFWYQTNLLARRAFVSALRDPLMTMVSLMFHLFVPFVMWIVYPRHVGHVHACPVIQRNLDLVTMASNRTLSRMDELQHDMLITFECSTMLFITAYALSMCTLIIAAMAFPLNMHILLKEVRNGWYNLNAFVLAKQIACFPFEVIFPSMTMAMIYIILDMPTSEYQWRLWSMALVMAIISMISNTHGLIIGTFFMDSVQSATFLAIATTLPQIMLSGFTARLKWLPVPLQHLSWISQYRYASQLINTIRFGFGICPCDDTTDNYLRTMQPRFTDLPDNLKSMFLYYLTTTGKDLDASNATIASTMNLSSKETTTIASSARDNTVPGVSYDLILNSTERNNLLSKMESDEIDIFGQMAEMMSRSLSYGRQITTCKSVRSQLLEATDTNTEDTFFLMFGYMIAVLVFFKIILLFVVRYKVGGRT